MNRQNLRTALVCLGILLFGAAVIYGEIKWVHNDTKITQMQWSQRVQR